MAERAGNEKREPEIVLTGLSGWLMKRLGIEPWGQVLIVVLALIGSGATTATWNRFGAIDTRLTAIDTRLTAIETRLNELPVEIANQTDAKIERLRSDLIKEFYSRANEALKNGNVADAARNLRAAAILTEMAADDRVPVDPSFFKRAVTSLQEIEAHFPGPSLIAGPAYKANVALAAYRSSIAPIPVISGQAKEALSPLTVSQLSEAPSYAMLVWRGDPGVEMFDFPHSPQPSELAKIPFGGGIVGGQQTLDGGLWQNVKFVKMHIIYRGGPLMLSNVKFIDCTFTFAKGANSAVLANYIALNSYSLNLS